MIIKKFGGDVGIVNKVSKKGTFEKLSVPFLIFLLYFYNNYLYTIIE